MPAGTMSDPYATPYNPNASGQQATTVRALHVWWTDQNGSGIESMLRSTTTLFPLAKITSLDHLRDMCSRQATSRMAVSREWKLQKLLKC